MMTGWLVPGLIVLGWLVILAVHRRVPGWYFVAGAGLAALCFPAGIVAGRLELASVDSCSPDNLCFSANELSWWMNGILGILTTGALALLTPLAGAVLAMVRRARR